MRNCELLGDMDMYLTAQLLNGYNVFKQERTSLDDVVMIGRPVTAVTEENIDSVRMLIEENPHIGIRSIAWNLLRHMELLIVLFTRN